METLFIIGIVFVVIPAVAGGIWKLFLLCCFPDAYRQTKQIEHERAMVKAARNQQCLGLFGSLFKLFR